MRKPARKLDDSTIAEIRKDHAAGMSVEQIRKKHNVGWITAKNAIDKGGKSSAKARPNGRGSNRRDATNEAVVAVSVDLLDRLLLALPPEKKAALLETV